MGDKSYVSYFACLLAGIYVAESLAPRMRDATFFEKFLLLGVTTYGGALMGTYIYKLYTYDEDECQCPCHDSGNEEE